MAYPVSLGPVSQSSAWVRTAATANETRHRNPVNPSEQAGARPASPTNFARDGAPIKEGRPRLYQIILVLQAKPTAISFNFFYRVGATDGATPPDKGSHNPSFRLRNRTRFLDFNEIALVVRVRIVVRVVFLRTHNILAVDRMLHAVLNQHGDRLVH